MCASRLSDRPSPIVAIPARLAASRLPDKPLAEIGGEPMIVQVWRRAMEADIGPVVVAAAEPVIAEAIGDAGGRAVLTDPDLPSGSDRVRAAVAAIDADGRHDVVVNVQGDLPTLNGATIRASLAPLGEAAVDIATLVAEIVDPAERTETSVVKAVVEWPGGVAAGEVPVGRALYFSRTPAPWGDGPLYHHIGLYAFRRAALDRFVTLPRSGLEQRERLEQLRALAHGMRIDVALVDTVPLGVDTPDDLERARQIFAASAQP